MAESHCCTATVIHIGIYVAYIWLRFQERSNRGDKTQVHYTQSRCDWLKRSDALFSLFVTLLYRYRLCHIRRCRYLLSLSLSLSLYAAAALRALATNIHHDYDTLYTQALFRLHRWFAYLLLKRHEIRCTFAIGSMEKKNDSPIEIKKTDS